MGPTRKSAVNRGFVDEKKMSHNKGGDEAKRSNSRKRKFSDMLGSQWATEELTLFYNSYRKYGQNWEKVACTLKNRSSEMVEALFMTNKAYLSLSHECSSAAGLCAMMTDRYNIMVESSEHKSNNGAGSSKMAKKLACGDVQLQPTTSIASSKKVVLKSPTITSRYGCLDTLRKKRSRGAWPHPVGQRTPRFPVEYPHEKNESPTTQGLQMKADELAREAAITLTEMLHKDSSPESSQIPNKRPESSFRPLQRKHSITERLKDGILNAEVDEDVLEGRQRLQICDLSGNKPNAVESVDGGIVTQKGRIPDDSALHMLADLSLVMSTENENANQQEKIRSAGISIKENVLSDPELQPIKISKPEKYPVLGISSIPEENEDHRLSTIETKRKRQMLPESKVCDSETHPDGGLPRTEVGDAKKSVTDESRKSAENNSPNGLWSSDNITKEGIDSTQSSVLVPEADQVSLPKSLGSRCRMKLKKPQSQKGFNFSHRSSNEQSDLPLGSPKDRAEEMLSNSLRNEQFRRWCTYEWFYSPIDYPWFAKRELVDYMHHIGLGHVKRLTRVEWGVIKSSLGELRRFSDQFLEEERENLNRYRESVRKHYSEFPGCVKEDSPIGIARPLSIGQHIIAIHPKTREIHDGTVLSFDCPKYQIQFHDHNLGVEFVQDTDCMPSSENCMNLFSNPNNADGVSQLSSPANPSCLPKQTNVASSEPDTPNKIKAKEADARAISELSRALSKKEAIVLELRRMNDDVEENSTLKNSALFEKQRSALLTQLNEANEKVFSALYFLRGRNTFNGKHHLAQPMPGTNLPDHDNSLRSPNDTTSILQESESHVNEIMDSSRTKARKMVDAAIQAISTFEWNKDTPDKIKDCVGYVNDQIPSDDSCIPLATDSKLSESSHISELISKCVATLIMIQRCTEQRLPPSDVAQIIQDAMMSLQPRRAQNLSVYTDIQTCLGIIKNQIIALVPKDRLA